MLFTLDTAASYELGPEDCETNVTMNDVNNSIVYVPNGTVCFKCVSDGLSDLFIFIVNERIIHSSDPLAHTVNTEYVDILVVPNTERVFTAPTLQCCDVLIGNSSMCDKKFITMKADIFLYYSKLFPLGFTITDFLSTHQHSTVL